MFVRLLGREKLKIRLKGLPCARSRLGCIDISGCARWKLQTVKSTPQVMILSFRLERKMLSLKHQQSEFSAYMKVSWPHFHGPRPPPKGQDFGVALDSESTRVVYLNKHPVYFGTHTLVLGSLAGSLSTKKASAAVRSVE